MPLISPTLPADGQSATAESVDNPLNAIIDVINGGLDNENIAAGGVANSNLAGGIDITKLGADALTGWTPLTQTFTYASNAGSKEFTITTPSDLTGILSPGMRFKVTRATTPPTQCFSFVAASSQYATKSSPSGITFTGDFTCEGWLKLASYTGQAQYVMNKFTVGSDPGFLFFISLTGQLALQFGGASAVSAFNTVQSLPLNTWIHVAVSVSVATPTAAFYINGNLVPSVSSSTAATALTQPSVDIRLGAAAAGTLTNTYYNGEMSEMRLWSVAQSQSSIEGNMAISLVGTESNLIGLWQGNGSPNDKTANANNLTLTSGAVDNTVDNPYNLIEYAIITKVAVSTGTTTITLFCGNAYTIPAATLSSPYYSTHETPFGFQATENIWHVELQYSGAGGATQSSPSSGTWYNIGSIALSVPIGAWKLKYSASISAQVVSGTSAIAVLTTLSTANNAESTPTLTDFMRLFTSTSETKQLHAQQGKDSLATLTSDTIYYLNHQAPSSGINDITYSSGRTIIRAVSSYV